MATSRLKIVFDENFPHLQIAFVSREADLGEIRHTRPMTWSGKHDKVWMPMAINAGFVIVTGDRNDKTRGYTVEDLKSMGARVILVGAFWDHMDRWAKAKWLVNSIEKIAAVAANMSPGSATLLVDKRLQLKRL